MSDPPAVEVITHEPLMHTTSCQREILPLSIRLHYSDGWLVCLDCGARIPAEVRETGERL